MLNLSSTISFSASFVIFTLRTMASCFGNTEYDRSAATALTSSYILTTSVLTSSSFPNVLGSPSSAGFPSCTEWDPYLKSEMT